VELLILDRWILEIGEAREKKKQARCAHFPDHVQDVIASSNPKSLATLIADARRIVNTQTKDEPVATKEAQLDLLFRVDPLVKRSRFLGTEDGKRYANVD
jgi:uncharacterized protein YajQ (UPF0234 family)